MQNGGLDDIDTTLEVQAWAHEELGGWLENELDREGVLSPEQRHATRQILADRVGDAIEVELASHGAGAGRILNDVASLSKMSPAERLVYDPVAVATHINHAAVGRDMDARLTDIGLTSVARNKLPPGMFRKAWSDNGGENTNWTHVYTRSTQVPQANS